MAVPIKLLLTEKGDGYGSGLYAIREREKDMIDISAYDDYLSDSTNTNNNVRIIKNNEVYVACRNYFDLDKNCRIYIAQKETESYDVWPRKK